MTFRCGLVLEKENKEEMMIKLRRNREEERKKRIFNARERIIGLDLKTLDKQIEEKNIEKKKKQHEFEQYAKYANNMDETIQTIQKEQERKYKLTCKELEEYRKKYQTIDKQNEYDINDPYALRKDIPARLGDDDARCTVSSMQKFSGEDLSCGKRLSLQKTQNRESWEKQMLDKQNKSSSQKTKKQIDDLELKHKIQTETNSDLQAKLTRRQHNIDHASYNLQLNKDIIYQNNLNKQKIEEMNLMEQTNARNSNFLNENRLTSKSYLKANSVIPYNWKGMDENELSKIRKFQLLQIEQNKEKREYKNRENEKCCDKIKYYDRANVLTNREENRIKKNLNVLLVQENERLAKLKKCEQEYINNELYKNEVTQEYYDQFNTVTR